MNGILLVCTGILIVTALWLVSEILKKDRFMTHYTDNNEHNMLRYEHPGMDSYGKARGMQNIVLRSNRPFVALIGFRLTWRGDHLFHEYGFMSSDSEHKVVISTYMMSGPTTFEFMIGRQRYSPGVYGPEISAHDVRASSTEDDQHLPPDVTYPPHWYMRGWIGRLLGLFFWK